MIYIPTDGYAAAHELGRAAADACEASAIRRDRFNAERARSFILGFLADEPMPGEEIVQALRDAEILIGDGRAVGSLFARMARHGEIVCLRSDLPRANGHGTSGGRLWALASSIPVLKA